jgi:succinate dehydrogenase / fumarate reductase membrane anchor subunit
MKFPRTSGGFYAWFFQRLTGILLVILLLIHFAITHNLPKGGEVSYAVVAPRLATATWKVFDLTFLVCALFHGLNGVWMVVQDYVSGEGAQTWIFYALCTLGLILLVLGAITVIPFKA